MSTRLEVIIRELDELIKEMSDEVRKQREFIDNNTKAESTGTLVPK